MTITRCHDRFTTNDNTHGHAWPCDSFRNGTGLIVCLWTALQVPLLMCCPFQKLNQAAGGGWGSWPRRSDKRSKGISCEKVVRSQDERQRQDEVMDMENTEGQS